MATWNSTVVEHSASPELTIVCLIKRDQAVPWVLMQHVVINAIVTFDPEPESQTVVATMPMAK